MATMRGRLASLDGFGKLTMAGMILVHHRGCSDDVYEWLCHMSWLVWTPTDLIFPFLLVIIGVAMPVLFDRRLQAGAATVLLNE